MNEERVEYSKGKTLDLELLLNRIAVSLSPLKKKHRRMSPYKQHLRPRFIPPRFVRVNTRHYKPRTGPAQRLFKIEGPTVRNKS